jgi:hypothetical protein
VVVPSSTEEDQVIIERKVPAGAILCGVLLVGVWTIPAEAQTQRAGSGGAWALPMTEWGHPDLQGNWANGTRTDVERPAGYGPIFSPAQVDSIEGAQQEMIVEGFAPSDPDRAALDVGNVGGYNEVYFERGDRVARVNGEPRTSLITFPANGRIPELSAVGARRVSEFREFRGQFGESDHPEIRPLSDRCLASYGSSLGPPILPNYGYNSNYTIVQNADQILIHAEMVHDTRVIRLDEPNSRPDDFGTWFGTSWGHWEGNTLVVETTNLHPGQIFNTVFVESGLEGTVQSDNLKITERFTRVDEGTILYEFEVDDPDTYSERWGGQVPMLRFDDVLYEYACHEGNYAMEGILGGARYQERMLTSQAPSGND